jgi:hypothetical protein
MITAHDLQDIANRLVNRHGIVALEYADRAVAEMQELGDEFRTDAWIALRSVVEDVLKTDAFSHPDLSSIPQSITIH